MSAILLENEIVHYEVLGRGRPILFLHGWVGSWRYWVPAMQAVSFAYRAYALDFWGYGDSAKIPERYSVQAQVNLIEAFFEALGIAKAALVGHAFGGAIALSFARQYPQRVDRLFTISLPTRPDAVNSRLWEDEPTVLANWLLDGIPGSATAVQDAPKTERAAISQSIADIQNLQPEKLITEIDLLCLHAFGADDQAISKPDFSAFDALSPRSHPILFEQSSHFPMLQESSKFHRLLLEFLKIESDETPEKLEIKEEWKRRFR